MWYHKWKFYKNKNTPMLIHCIKKAFSKKNIFYTLLFVSLFFAFQEISFAADTTNNFEKKTIDVMNMFLKIFWSLLWVVTAFVSIFLHPGWYNGQIFDLNIYLKDIWILMSNVVYFIFAFLLIFIAFMNIIGKEWAHQEYQLKSALPKFIVWVLIVPFTWFIVQFVLSISAILTVSMLALPFDTFEEYKFFTEIWKRTICTSYEIPLWKSLIWTKATTAWSSTPPTDSKIEESIKCTGTTKSIKDIVASATWNGATSDSIFWIVSIYTYWILWLHWLDTLWIKEINSWVKEITDITLKIIFDIIFVVAYCLLMLALFLALFTRWVWLWIYTMMSPLFGLIYFFWDPHDESLKKFKFSEFIALAMVPVYVAAALSFWLVFIMVAWDGMRKSANNPVIPGEKQLLECSPKPTNPPTVESSKVPTTCKINVWDFSFEMSWSVWDSGNILGWAMWALWTLIIQMFGLVILWLSVMAALHASKITEAAAAPIHHLWESIWKTAMKMPQYAPILPGGMSPKGLETAATSVSWAIEWNAQKKWSDLAHKHFWELMGWEKGKKLSDAALDITKASGHMNKYNSLRSWLSSAWSTEEIARSPQLKNALIEWFKSIKDDGTYWFKTNKEEFEKLMTKLWSSSATAQDWKEWLHKLETDAINHNNTLLWNSNGVDAKSSSDVDSVIASMAKNWATPTPQTSNIQFNVYRWDSWVEKSKIINLDWFAEHVKNKKGQYTKDEFKNMLTDVGITWNEDEVINELWDDFFKTNTSKKT